jgi:signal transduction histidine kinase
MEDVPMVAAAPGTAPGPLSSIPRQLRLIRIVFVAALLSLAGAAALAYYSTTQNAENARWVDHTYEVIITTNKVFSELRGATATARGYATTADASLRDRYREYSTAIPAEIAELRRLVGDNSQELARVQDLERLSREILQGLEQTMAARAISPVADKALIPPVLDSHRRMDDVVTVTRLMTADEDRLLAERRSRAGEGRRLTIGVIVVGNVVSLAVLLLCLYLLTREISERRRAEARVHALNLELAGRNAQLELTNRELEGFSYSISHDLRAPLRAIDGFAQLLRTRYASVLDAEAMRLLDVVRDSGHRMATLIDDLLAFSRMGRKSLDTDVLAMGALVGDCVAEVLRAVPERPRILIGPLPDCRGDPTLVRQVWVNLIGNAVKYSSRNPGARIEITGRQDAHECIYSVTDNGVGFDMQYYHKLFGVFQRLHRADEFPGTGVGLAIAMRIVTKHGGRLWADAAVGQGANFLFSLPRTESP